VILVLTGLHGFWEDMNGIIYKIVGETYPFEAICYNPKKQKYKQHITYEFMKAAEMKEIEQQEFKKRESELK